MHASVCDAPERHVHSIHATTLGYFDESYSVAIRVSRGGCIVTSIIAATF